MEQTSFGPTMCQWEPMKSCMFEMCPSISPAHLIEKFVNLEQSVRWQADIVTILSKFAAKIQVLAREVRHSMLKRKSISHILQWCRTNISHTPRTKMTLNNIQMGHTIVTGRNCELASASEIFRAPFAGVPESARR
jgi:hypothetical protein